ncbi:MAG: type II toxin-antitoxin system YafQ family toxin [Candidatus Adiutrix sp.]|jgi:mRNA interferase YafQ|nr:type II toxin-antitoxin system YafQ family toxin [Candidatus Adiutrix sp.]
MKLQADYTGRFKKDYKLSMKRGLPMEELDAVMDMLITGNPLPEKYQDHQLGGNYKNHRECHVQPDWLLVYRLSPTMIHFVRTGTHSDIF